MSDRMRLPPGALALLRRIAAVPTFRAGYLFSGSDVGVLDAETGRRLIHLREAGLLSLAVDLGNATRWRLTPDGRALARRIWPPDGDPHHTAELLAELVAESKRSLQRRKNA